MSNNADFEYKDNGLRELLDILEGNIVLPSAKVGILGASNSRPDDDGLSNAQVGFYHEFGIGDKNRSFLRMPLVMNLNRELSKAGIFKQEVIEKLLSEKDGLTFVRKIGVVAEGIVLDAFHTGGFGAWKPSNMAHKKNKQTLVESTQLRDSITYEVVDND